MTGLGTPNSLKAYVKDGTIQEFALWNVQNLGYLTYHDLEEEHHSQATLDELLENFRESWFDAGKFLSGAEQILTDGVQAYYSSQLATLPEKDSTWPASAASERAFDPAKLRRLPAEMLHL